MRPTLYQKEFKECQQLTLKQEQEYITKAKTDNYYKEIVTNAFIKQVFKIAEEYQRDNIDGNELIQQGILGLYKAIERYDPSRKNRFSTYARWWIKAFIIKHYRQHVRSFRISSSVSGKLKKVLNATDELEQKLGRQPSVKEIAETLNVKEKKVDFWMKFLQTATPIHLLNETSNYPSKSDRWLADNHIDSPSERAVRNDGVLKIKKCIAKLTKIEQVVISSRYGLNNDDLKTLHEVGAELNLTAEGIRQIQLKAENKLKRMMNK